MVKQLKNQKRQSKQNKTTKSKEMKEQKQSPETTSGSDATNGAELIHFTNIRKGSIKPPTKSQLKKYKVPEIDLTIDENKINMTANLSGASLSDITFSINQNSLVVLSNNKKTPYYTDIKIQDLIIPQSAVANFRDGTLIVTVQKSNGSEPWKGITQMQAVNKELLETKSRLTKLQEQYHAIQLDYQNLLVKSKKDIDNKVDTYKISVIEKLLKNIDNFNLALNSTLKMKNKDNEQIILGINLILNELVNMIKEEGVTEIQTKGLLLDPTLHEVMDCIKTDKHPENTILEEFQKGYRYKDKVLRPSKVKVAIAPKEKQKKKK